VFGFFVVVSGLRLFAKKGIVGIRVHCFEGSQKATVIFCLSDEDWSTDPARRRQGSSLLLKNMHHL